jgi:hypothetical protein
MKHPVGINTLILALIILVAGIIIGYEGHG